MKNLILHIRLMIFLLMGWCVSTCEWNDHKEDNTCDDGEISAADAVWSHGEGDLQNTKRASGIRQKGCFTGPQKNPQVLWSFDIGGSGTGAAPVIAPDGTIYLVAEYPGGTIGYPAGVRNTGLFAISPQGQMKWFLSKPLDLGNIESMFYREPVAIGKNGTIYFAWYDGYLYAINPDSTTKWKYKLADGPIALAAPPVIDEDGYIYTGSDTLFCFYPNGKVRWKYYDSEHANQPSTAVALAPSAIYSIVYDLGILALDYQGKKKWFTPTNTIDFFWRSLIVDQEENIYFQSGGFGENFHCLDRNGNSKWNATFSHFGSITRAVLRGDYLYFASWDVLARVDKETGTQADSLGEVAVVGDGNAIMVDDEGSIYVGGVRNGAGSVNMISANTVTGGFMWNLPLPELTGFGARPALSPDGTLYFVSYYSSAFRSDVRKLYAIK